MCRHGRLAYGVVFEASMITGIDRPPEVEWLWRAIKHGYNQVSRATSDWPPGGGSEIVQFGRAVRLKR